MHVPAGRFDLAYVLRINRFQGERTLQLEWINARGVEVAHVQRRPAVSAPDFADYRALLDPLPVLRVLWEQHGMQVWAEAAELHSLEPLTRFQLEVRPTLAVWTIPPSAQVLAQVLAAVRPVFVYLFAVDPGLDVPELFMRRLAGLIKHALQAYDGRLEWDALAAATAHRVETVQSGVDWLISRGQISVTSTGPEAIVVSSGGAGNPRAAQQSRLRLEDLLRETEAYRRFFREADAASLVVAGS
jgi:single-stranded-DNA-specific exonuclease